MRIAIVDDEKFYLERIRSIVEQTLPEYETKCYQDVSDFIKEADEFAIVLLDIAMPGEDGIELAKKLRQKGCVIIFVTSMKERMQEAFGKHVEGFVLKEDLMDQLPKVLEIVDESLYIDHNFIYKDDLGRENKLAISSIYYLEVYRKDVYVYKKDEKIHLPNMTLKECYNQLDRNFVYASRHMIVNVAHMVHLNKQYQIFMDNEEVLYTNRYCYKDVREKFMEIIL
ncbi:LytR/AlgR family response regulator transcription factor [[Eubacterium] hominis]|uniref:LytR/AlgR family response regulator transcription factor n=1 Tax=[Eubacterium] hominis TaxID=2764325 RepID=UPI003A4E4130